MEVAPAALTLQLPHLRLSALAWGPSDGVLALCLHGFPDTAWCWRYLGPELASLGYRVVAPFTRGYAPSDIPPDRDYHIGALMYDALAIHEHLRAKNAVLIGHDWGAVTSNAIAAYPMNPFSKVVSLSVPPFPAMNRVGRSLPRNAGVLLRQLKLSWYISFIQLPGIPEQLLHKMIPKLWRDWAPGYDTKIEVSNALNAIPNAAHRQAMLSYYRALTRPNRCSRRYATMQRYSTATPLGPMLCLHGEQDRALQIDFAAKVLDVLPAGSQAETVANAGHFLLVEQPEVVNRHIIDYLGSPSSP
ncbi:alpha/beta fold hydrolase [Mycobacterium sp.]|uniref:alpha/beta fold hydrolase n=1 Tax=Mycobacterium sp. TaxID=1785 RepID=UPI003BAC4E50